MSLDPSGHMALRKTLGRDSEKQSKQNFDWRFNNDARRRETPPEKENEMMLFGFHEQDWDHREMNAAYRSGCFSTAKKV
jgi:hypothetical protein